jgi:hypothetical protein
MKMVVAASTKVKVSLRQDRESSACQTIVIACVRPG